MHPPQVFVIDDRSCELAEAGSDAVHNWEDDDQFDIIYYIICSEEDRFSITIKYNTVYDDSYTQYINYKLINT